MTSAVFFIRKGKLGRITDYSHMIITLRMLFCTGAFSLIFLLQILIDITLFLFERISLRMSSFYNSDVYYLFQKSTDFFCCSSQNYNCDTDNKKCQKFKKYSNKLISSVSLLKSFMYFLVNFWYSIWVSLKIKKWIN